MMRSASTITTAAIIVVAVFIAGVVSENARRLAAVSRVVTALDSRVVGKSPEGWHRADQREWVAALEAANPSLVVPAVEVPR